VPFPKAIFKRRFHFMALEGETMQKRKLGKSGLEV
jgi:hypothetical protein